MKRKLSLIIASMLLVVVAAVLVAFFNHQRASADQESSRGDGWEYLVVAGGTANLSASGSPTMRKEPGPFNREWFPVEQNMDKLGLKGWELVSVSGPISDPIFFFKRRK
jgi:hypothetical protein